MVKQVAKFVAKDGTEFYTEHEALAHEKKLDYENSEAGKLEKKYNDQLNTYWFKHSDASLSTFGTWEIYGEDPNPDFGGSHHEPHLETVEGTLEQAIRYAITLKNYYAWGGGGRIKAAKPVKVLKL